jgi:hypothetical protein
MVVATSADSLIKWLNRGLFHWMSRGMDTWQIYKEIRRARNNSLRIDR